MKEVNRIEVSDEQLKELEKAGFNLVLKSGNGKIECFQYNYEISKFKEPQTNDLIMIEIESIDRESLFQLKKELDLYMKLYNFSLANGWEGSKNGIKYEIQYDSHNKYFFAKLIESDIKFMGILFQTEEIAEEAIRRYRKELEDVFGMKEEEVRYAE